MKCCINLRFSREVQQLLLKCPGGHLVMQTLENCLKNGLDENYYIMFEVQKLIKGILKCKIKKCMLVL